MDRPVPVCADESCHDRESLSSLDGKYDVINIKLDKTGGLTEALKLREAALARGFEVMVGCMVGSSLAMRLRHWWHRAPLSQTLTDRFCWPKTAIRRLNSMTRACTRLRLRSGDKAGGWRPADGMRIDFSGPARDQPRLSPDG